jgi:methylphosphotriester-DNA--protein-cysteine methyltransferase
MFRRLKAIFKRLRQQNAAAERPMYIGHKWRRVYHRQHCKWAMRIWRSSRRFLFTREQAMAEGFRPCKSCQPDRNPYKPGDERPGFQETFAKVTSRD